MGTLWAHMDAIGCIVLRGLTLSHPMTPYGVIMVIVSPYVYGNSYGEFNTRRCALVHDFCFL